MACLFSRYGPDQSELLPQIMSTQGETNGQNTLLDSSATEASWKTRIAVR